MNLQQLWYFKILAETESLSGTARKLLVSAPSLSATLRRLEQELGCQLFDRVGRRIRLNEHGRILLSHVDIVFAELDNARLELEEQSNGPRRLALGITSPMAWLDAISAFTEAYPQIKLTHSILKLEQLQDSETCRPLDLIVTASNDLDRNEWNVAELRQASSPCLAVWPGHRLSGRSSLRLIEAKDEPFIHLARGYSFRAYADQLFSLAGFEPRIVLECDFVLRRQMLEERHGVVLTTRYVGDAGLLGQATIIPISQPDLPRRHAIFWHKHKTLSQAGQLFRDFALSYFDEKS